MKLQKITTLLIFVSFCSYSQTKIDSLEGRIYLKEVREVSGSKSELKARAYQWVAKSFNNSNHTVRINNDDQILAKGGLKVGADYKSGMVKVYVPRDVEYTLDIQFREGRYKVEVNQVRLSPSSYYDDNELKWYFMDFETYSDEFLRIAESYEGVGKKAIMKQANNEKKVRKRYGEFNDYAIKIIPQLTSHFDLLELSLFSYMKTGEGEDDW